jgi:hypothetical protein
VPLFCRHNRFEQNCPICSREKEAERRATRPTRTGRVTTGTRHVGAPAAPARTKRLVTRKIARAADDGYRNDLVPGLRATEDAQRLAACLILATQRLEFPGPHPEIAEESDPETATRRAFMLTVGEDAGGLISAYDAWAARQGGAVKAITGEPSWAATRRFARAFERLSLPGITRGQRFDFLAVLGAAAVYELEADALHPSGTDATTVAAKRLLVSGDTMLLERRAKALTEATGVPVAALDRGLATWDSPAPVEAPEGPLYEQACAALAVDPSG